MAASAIHNHGLPSSYHLHLQTPMVPVIGYFQPGYLVCSQTGIPLHPQNQLQPSYFEPSTSASFTGRSAINGYHGLMSCSWVLGSQEEQYGSQPYQSDSFLGQVLEGNYSHFMPFHGSCVLNSQGEGYRSQPYQSDSFSGRAVDGNYSHFMPFHGSWVLDSQEKESGPQPYQSDSFSGREADSNYSHQMPCDGSWVINSQGGQPQPYIDRYNPNVTNPQASLFPHQPENRNYQFTACDNSLILDAI